jgi:lipopolysaccharide/colanic/teichoic acid biosynthesis glycosyltransferase
MRKQSRALVALAVGIVATSVPAFADVVGQSIGSDLMVDASYGGGLGYTVVNWNDADGTWDEAVRLDLYYVDNWSLTYDLGILWRTIWVVLKRKGAY